MSLSTGAPAQNSTSSTLDVPPSGMLGSRTSSSSSESSSHESGPSTPATSSSIHSSIVSSSLQVPKTVPPATTPHRSDSPARSSYEESRSSTTNSSSCAPSPDQAAQDAPEKTAVGSMPTQSHFNPSPISLKPSTLSENSASLHGFSDENGATQGVTAPEVTVQYADQSTKSTWCSMMKNWMSQRSWLQNTMASTMLTATLIGLFIYQRRSYRVALWAAENDFMQSCIGLAQLNHSLSERCKKVIEEGVGEAPYTKRGLYSRPRLNSTQSAEPIPKSMAAWNENSQRIWTPTGIWTPQSAEPVPKLMAAWNENSQGIWTGIHYLLLFTSAMLILGVLLYWLVYPSRNEPAITSQAQTEVKVTRHYSDGALTIISDGSLNFTKNYPGDDHPLGEIRRRLVGDRAQNESRDSIHSDGYLSNLDSKNSSANTLVGSWTGSEIFKVSITTSHDQKKHDGLLELRSTDSTKHFLDPDTGEFIHLTPWKSTTVNGDKASTRKAKPKHDVSHVVAKIVAASAAVTSKNVDEKTLAKEKKKWTKGIKEVKEEGERKLAREIKERKEKKDAKDKKPPRAGDCITGNIIQETPSAKPTLVL